MPRSYQKTNTALKQSSRSVLRWNGSEHPPLLVRARTTSIKRLPRRRGNTWLKPTLIVGLVLLLSGLLVQNLKHLPQLFLAKEPLLLNQPQQIWLPELEPQSTLTFTHRIRRGDTLGKILSGFGAKSDAIEDISTALKSLTAKHHDNFLLRPGADLLVQMNEGELREMRQELDQARTLIVKRNQSGAYQAKLIELPRAYQEVVAAGAIETSFAAAAAKAGMPYDVVDDFADLFGDRVSFHQDFRKGDRFVIIYQSEMLSDGTALAAGPVLAARLEVGGKNLVALRYVGTDGKARYFNEKGELIGNTFLRYPLKFTRISSYYSDARMHPIFERKMPHLAVDLAAPVGTPVRAVADGTVLIAARRGGAGIMIKLNHSPRYQTGYLHLSRIDASVRQGARVSRGQIIGFVGMTGNATGPHLHYALWDRGQLVNPLTAALPTVDDLGKGLRVDRRYLSRVLYTLDHYYTNALHTPNFGSN